jgi:hypothetical protein
MFFYDTGFYRIFQLWPSVKIEIFGGFFIRFFCDLVLYFKRCCGSDVKGAAGGHSKRSAIVLARSTVAGANAEPGT